MDSFVNASEIFNALHIPVMQRYIKTDAGTNSEEFAYYRGTQNMVNIIKQDIERLQKEDIINEEEEDYRQFQNDISQMPTISTINNITASTYAMGQGNPFAELKIDVDLTVTPEMQEFYQQYHQQNHQQQNHQQYQQQNAQFQNIKNWTVTYIVSNLPIAIAEYIANYFNIDQMSNLYRFNKYIL